MKGSLQPLLAPHGTGTPPHPGSLRADVWAATWCVAAAAVRAAALRDQCCRFCLLCACARGWRDAAAAAHSASHHEILVHHAWHIFEERGDWSDWLVRTCSRLQRQLARQYTAATRCSHLHTRTICRPRAATRMLYFHRPPQFAVRHTRERGVRSITTKMARYQSTMARSSRF